MGGRVDIVRHDDYLSPPAGESIRATSREGTAADLGKAPSPGACADILASGELRTTVVKLRSNE